MPLLCTSLLALLLLPLTLSCDSPMKDVRDRFRAIVRTHLISTRERVKTLLHNSSCPELKHKPPNCTTDKPNIVNTLLILACKMRSLRLSHAGTLARYVQQSIDCPCIETLTEEPNARSTKKRRTPTRTIPKELKKSRREAKKLCKAKAILSSMTECYEILNSLLMDTVN